MNKKISTLMAGGFLLTSVFASAQFTIDPADLDTVTTAELQKGGTFVILESTDKEISDDDRIFSANSGTYTYASCFLKTYDTYTDAAKDKILWNLAVSQREGDLGDQPSYYYTLQNVNTKSYLSFEGSTHLVVEDKVEAPLHGEKDGKTIDIYSYFAAQAQSGANQIVQYGRLYSQSSNNNANRLLANIDGTTIKLGPDSEPTTNKYLLFCKFRTVEKPATAKTAEELNETLGGAGFGLSYTSDEIDSNDGWLGNKVDTTFKAFAVESNIPMANGSGDYEIPAGVYLAVDYPESLNNSNVITTEAEFRACTFLAVLPTENYDIHKVDATAGTGFGFDYVSGNDMNFYKGSADDPKTEKAEVYVGNACMTVELPNPTTDEETFNLLLKNIRVQTDATKDAHKNITSGVYVGVINDKNDNHLVTTIVDYSLNFKVADIKLVTTDLLNKEDVPAVYTVQFASDINETSEEDLYLTAVRGASDFALAVVVDFNEADPMYQFVITAVDKEKGTVTFTNRQTGKDWTTKLYKNEDGTYTVYEDGELSIETFDKETGAGESNNEVVTWDANGKLLNTRVILNKITVEDKFATFVNREEGDGLVTFELAKNSEDVTAFYVGAKINDDGKMDNSAVLAYEDAENATQFELIKSEKPEIVQYNYYYMNGDRLTPSEKLDTVAAYTYNLKAFDAEQDNLYLGGSNANALSTASTPTSYIIKQNVDGSVSLIKASSDLDNPTLNYLSVPTSLKKEKNPAWETAYNYDYTYKKNSTLKTFMVDEDPALSWEAVPQHVSFATNNGNFLTVDANNDAFQTKSENNDDLVFWLDTVYSKQTVPSFYISHAGKFLYNAEDSIDVNPDRYELEIASGVSYGKLVFKAGELISSDTLSTTIDGKETLVINADNAPKGIRGGLENFQYQIISAEDGSDDWLIRQGRTNYVCQYNNYFYLGSSKKNAVRFTIEKEEAPTANEDAISASEVKVIAGNGQITIAGAAGKKVVVSNILGQVVANTVITSDNATIAAPQGIVVVAVEGEEAVKAIVK